MAISMRSKPATFGLHPSARRLLPAIGCVLVALIAAGGLLFDATFAEEKADPLAEGDTHFTEKSYRKAYESYEQYLSANPESDQWFRIKLRMGHCQAQLGNFDQAETELVSLADREGLNELERARAGYRLGRFYTERPNYYYENAKGERSWGRYQQGSRYHNVEKADAEKAKTRLMQAYQILKPHAEQALGQIRANTDYSVSMVEETFNAGMDAAAALQTWQYHAGSERKSVDYLDRHGQKQTWHYSKHLFPDRDAIIALYDDLAARSAKFSDFAARAQNRMPADVVAKLIEAEGKGRTQAALATYRKGTFLVALTEIDDWRMRNVLYHPELQDFDPLKGEFSPLPVFESVYRDFHDTPFADDAQFYVGYCLAQVGRHSEAEAAYEKLVNDPAFKESTETASARYALQQIRAERLSVRTLADESEIEAAREVNKWPDGLNSRLREESGTSRSTFKPGEHIGLWVETRNTKQFKVRALTFDLGGMMRDNEFLTTEAAGFSNIGDPAIEKIVNRYVGEQVFEKAFDTEDSGARLYTRTTLPMPQTLPVGSYVIEVDSGGVLNRRLVVVSETQLVVQTYNPTENLALLVDAESGAPLAGAQFVYKRWRTWWRDNSRHWSIDNSTYAGDEQGRARVPAGGSAQWDGYLLFAEAGGRYAFFQGGFEWWQRRGYDDHTTADLRVYPMTDRPVYRPGDTVQGKIIIRQRDGGEWENVAGMSAHLEIRDPRGEKRFDRTLRASPFGAIEYELPLAGDAALGNWRFILRSNRSGNWLGSGYFAVEEYKKPEFEVTVTPPAKPIKVGAPVSATIKGEYYFGGPAAGADVSYKVYRDFYFHSVYFPRRFDWLYNWQSPTRYGTPDQQFRRNAGSELITEGQGKLNEIGELVIEWNTQKALTDWPEYDHQYRVEAEVTDASRRTIEGKGAVKALRRAFFAFVDNKLGFYRPGDRLDVEIRCLTADDQPVQTQGKLEVYSVKFAKRTDEEGMPKIDEHKTLVATHDVSTDERGLASFRESLDEAGTYELVFRTTDEWDTEISGSQRVIVKAMTWQPGSFNFGTLSLIPQQKVYVQGEKAKVLIAGDTRDAWMLISVMAGREVIDQNFVSVGETGGQMELEIDINRSHVPNFHINVLTIQRGELHTDTLELFVPPDEQFLDVQISSDKEWYKPGEKGTLSVTAKDKDGNPVDAEFALTVFDRSVTYIAADNTPNIIKHFYGDRRGYQLNFNNSYETSVAPRQWDKQEYEDLRWYGAPLGWGVRNWMQWEKQHFDFDELNQDRASKYKAGFDSVSRPEQDGEQGKSEDKVDGLRELDDSAVGLSGGVGGGFAHRRARGGGTPADASAPGAAAPVPSSEGEMLEAGRADESSNESPKADWGEAVAEEEGVAVPRVRSNFKDTAFYSHRVRTGADGTATIEVTFPDNLTDWRVAARGITSVAKVGEGFHAVKTTKKLILRDQAPRFFVEGDVVTLSGVIMNRYDEPLAVKAMLLLNPKDTATADELAAFCDFQLFPETPDVRDVTIPAGGEMRIDWQVRMTSAGQFKIRMLALSTTESDATEKVYPCKVRGAEMYQAHTAVINDNESSQSFTVELPNQLDPAQTHMDLQLSPSVAALAMDAIPYLLQFPYGCVEQTMSRFLPAVIVRKTLQDSGISLEEIGERRARLEYSGVNPQAAYWYKRSPVFDTATLEAILDAGIKRLSVMQQGNGGWGWWQSGPTDTYMSAYVVYGLHTAKVANVPFDYSMLDRGVKFLAGEARREKNLNRAAYIAYVLSYAGTPDKELLDKLYERRDDLTHQTRAMICMAEHLAGDKERARILISNIEDYRREDLDNGTVWWDGGQQYWWWWNDKIETNAFVMRAFTMVDPKNKFLEQHVRWLAQNRKGSRWNSTKDTSHAVNALMDYARVSGELSRTYSVTVKRNGEPIHTWDVTPENVFALQTNIRLDGTRLPPGKHNFTIEREGEGKVYFSSFVRYFSKEDRLKASGNQIHIERKYYKLVEKQEEVTVKKQQPDGSIKEVQEMRLAYDRVPMEYGAQMDSGDKIEVELGITADNDYEYLSFEDYKPAGCEPVALRSGQGFAGGLCQNVELRDDRVAFFVSYMQQGYVQLKYQLRCEIPGTFSALPTQGGSMYVAEVKANSEEFKLSIVDS